MRTLRVVEGFDALPRVTSDAKPFPAGGTLAACETCGAVQKLPDQAFLDEINRIYSAYSLYGLADGEEQSIFVDGEPRRRSDILVDLIEQHGTLDRIIDIGCGNGAALRTFSRRKPGSRLWGSELSDRNAASLRAIANFQDLFTKPIGEIPNRFDTLTMIHVLEHVLDPVQFLRDCAGLLEPDGVMLVDVPDVETSAFDLIIADHLSHFSVNTLRYALQSAGLAVSQISNRVIHKEVTALAKPGPVSEEWIRPVDDDITRAQRGVDWLTGVLAEALATPSDRPLGIFGTSMAGMWLYGGLQQRVGFFVDEDEAKIGNRVGNLPILHPMSVPEGARVLVPLPPATAIRVANRWGSPARDYVALGTKTALGPSGGVCG